MNRGEPHRHVGPVDDLCWQLMSDDWKTCGLDLYHDIHASPLEDMTREQRVRTLVAKWQPRLGLQAWDIRYDEAAPCEADEEAAILCDDQEQLAQLVINPATSDPHLESIVIHELIHVVMRLYDNLANSAAGTLGATAGPMVMEQIDNEQERVINRIVEAITGRRDVSKTRIELHKYTAWKAA